VPNVFNFSILRCISVKQQHLLTQIRSHNLVTTSTKPYGQRTTMTFEKCVAIFNKQNKNVTAAWSHTSTADAINYELQYTIPCSHLHGQSYVGKFSVNDICEYNKAE